MADVYNNNGGWKIKNLFQPLMSTITIHTTILELLLAFVILVLALGLLIHELLVMIDWNQQKKVLKRPALTYALFLKNTWKEQAESGRNISDMCKYAKDQWGLMSEDAKNVYCLIYDYETEAYKETIEKLNNGEINIDAIGEQVQVPINNENDN